MKRLPILLLLLWAMPMMAQHWTVEQVPNTRLQSNEIHVSDPDSLIDDVDEAKINQALTMVRDSADVFVVALNSVGDEEPKVFATNLFNKWGIGDKEKKNGLLLLMVFDEHAIEVETGYGTEGLLPDLTCKKVIDDVIIPKMKDGDYSGGMREGAFAFARLLGGSTDSLGIGTVADYSNVTYPKLGITDTFPWGTMCVLSFITMIVGFCRMVYGWFTRSKKKKEKTPETFGLKQQGEGQYLVDAVQGKSTDWGGNAWENQGCLRFLVMGMSGVLVLVFATSFFEGMGSDGSGKGLMWVMILLWLTGVCVWHNMRSIRQAKKRAATSIRPAEIYSLAKDSGLSLLTMCCAPWVGYFFYKQYKKLIQEAKGYCNCPECGEKMKLKDKVAARTDREKKEVEIGSLSYRSYRCSNNHEVTLKDKGGKFKKFTVCAACGGRTNEELKTEVVKEATYTDSGLKRITYHCQFCGKDREEEIRIPKKESSTSSSSSSGGGWSGGSGGGGSFGGGSSGGGGASGRW